MFLRHDFIMEANIMNPDQTAFYIGSSFLLSCPALTCNTVLDLKVNISRQISS